MRAGKPDTDDEELIIFDAAPIWKDGRVLKDTREIIEYIDTQMRPESLDDQQDADETWPQLRAHLMHMHLSTPEERAEAFQQAIKEGVDIGHWILKRMRERYPEYW